MEKVKKLITLNSVVTLPFVEAKDYTVGVHIVFDFRGQRIAKGSTEEGIQKKMEATVFGKIPEVMAEYVAICFAMGSEDGENPNHLESTLNAHLKELSELAKSALEERLKKQNVRDQ